MNEFIFLGDSITDCGHIYDPDGLGDGYVRNISLKLDPEWNRCINLGYDGFTISALKRLWKMKSNAINPKCITILIGINDIAVIKNTGLDTAFALETFQMNYEMLIENIREKFNCPIILIEPFIFPYPQEFITWEPELQKMSSIIENIAQRYHLHFLPTWQNLSNAAMATGYPSITIDGVHLTSNGHKILAQLWMDFVTKTLII